MLIALSLAACVRADTSLVFNELMFHPASNAPAMEWIEFYNPKSVDLDISGWRLSEDLQYTFPEGARAKGGGYLLLAADPAAVRAATGLTNVYGPYTNRLSRDAGTLEIRNNSGWLMDRVSYDARSEWPVAPAGSGASLAKRDRETASLPAENWVSSYQVGGTPGKNNFPTGTPAPSVVFNEIAPVGYTFWVELVNAGPDAVALDGWTIHLEGQTSHDHVFSSGTTLGAGGFLVLSVADLGCEPTEGDRLFLYEAGRATVRDAIDLGRHLRGRSPDGTGAWFRASEMTPGTTNQFSFHSEVVINEIMYHHAPIPSSNGSPPGESSEQWIELYNRGSNIVDLTGWALVGGISFSFPVGSLIAPGAYLVVTRDAAAFRSTHPNVPLVGDFAGRLSQKGEHLRLKDAEGNLADEVDYHDRGRWPVYADGGGSSLELRDPNSDNSKGESWAASNEADRSGWQTYSYRMIANIPPGSGQPTNWNDFALGLLDAGECLIDNLVVIESPDGPDSTPMVANGDFEEEDGIVGWRMLGNHRHSRVEVDANDPANHVLHLIATGAQEHMHNHVEATTIGNRPIVNGREYEISFRARWLAGNNLLNSRLYFNRCARTTALPLPEYSGTPGAQNSRFTENIGPTFSAFGHQPVIPLPGEAVTVSVVAQDPNGVGECRLCWSVNGGPWFSILMSSEGQNRFTGSIPGYAATNIVQFYIEAVDQLGATASFPAAGPDSGALYVVKDGAANLTRLHNLRFILSPANRDLLYADTNRMSNETLPCTVVYDERKAYYDARMRLKGSERGRNTALPQGLGCFVVFPPDDCYLGVHPIMIVDRSGNAVENRNREILVKHMMQRAGGIPGVYSDLCRAIGPRPNDTASCILSPREEDEFMEAAFVDGSEGTMWEMELIYYPVSTNVYGYKLPTPDSVLSTDIRDLGDDKEIYRYNFIRKQHHDRDDFRGLMSFAKSFSLESPELTRATSQLLDMDEWARAYALISLCGVDDVYTFSLNVHNLRLYLRPTDGQMLCVPHDLDREFLRTYDQSLMGATPAGVTLAKVLQSPGNLRRVYAHALDLLDSVYSTNYMRSWVTHYNGLVPEQRYSSVNTYMRQRSTAVRGQISAAQGNVSFDVASAVSLTSNSNLVVVAGTAPFQVQSICVNGQAYPLSWNSPTNWALLVPVSEPTNTLVVEAFDLRGKLLPGLTRTRTVIYSGTVPDPAGFVMFSEIMPNSTQPEAAYVELFNAAPGLTFDLSGWRVKELGYTFPPGSLIASGGFLVLAASQTGYLSAYGVDGPLPFAQFTNILRFDQGTLTLLRPGASSEDEIVVDRVYYENKLPWPVVTDGSTSLQLLDAGRDNSRVVNWAAGAPTPGRSNSVSVPLPDLPPIWLNEVQPENIAGRQDHAGERDPWIELFNSGTTTQSLAGFFLTDEYGDLTRWPFPAEATISPGEFLVVWCDGQSDQTTARELHTSFRLPPDSGSVALARWPDDPQIVSYLNYSRLPANWSYGSVPDGQPFFLQPMFTASPGATNNSSAPKPLVFINEWMAQNTSTLRDPADNNFADWFELFNPGPLSADLGGCFLTDNPGLPRLSEIPDNGAYVIPPGGYLLVWANGRAELNAVGYPDLFVNFVLSREGDSIGLYSRDGSLIDSVSFGVQTADVSSGRYPDGAAAREFLAPTPAEPNVLPAPVTLASAGLGSAGQVRLGFSTTPGRIYLVEFKDNLEDAEWFQLSGYLLAESNYLEFDDAPGSRPQRFYRVVMLPAVTQYRPSEGAGPSDDH